MNLWNVPVEMSFLKSRMNLKMRMNFDMVCKKCLPAVKCEHPGRKRSHKFNLHISNMDILQKNWFKSLLPARNRRSNILLHTLRGCHRLLNWHCQLSRAINYLCPYPVFNPCLSCHTCCMSPMSTYEIHMSPISSSRIFLVQHGLVSF